ncbi:hypothetical protein GP486_001446 [Trichoglossum hirsutum]|uniref:Tafazzin n=1 Tax=Trichoglossum hirsutum TaxID=265104 RepID=A0A9P8RSL6_9PEZI|nr:hypothetical protein GP486_001446 [Trichoglossum hirsutum]
MLTSAASSVCSPSMATLEWRRPAARGGDAGRAHNLHISSPASIASSIHAPSHLGRRDQLLALSHPHPQRTNRLPGTRALDPRSLLHQTLKALAKNWVWHLKYDQNYLAVLPQHLKSLFLGYAAVYAESGVGYSGLRALFLTQEEFEGSSGSNDITHLDLSNSLCRKADFDGIRAYLRSPPSSHGPAASPVAAVSRKGRHTYCEDWEKEAEALLIPSPFTPRFPNLTHLSLSHPSSGVVSWAGLLDFAPHAATLTHLSLAYWPAPPSSKPAKKRIRPSIFGGDPLQDTSNDEVIAPEDYEEFQALRRLSRAMYCLRWLDLEGCGSWIPALRGAEWNAAWRKVETVRLTQGWVPAVRDGKLAAYMKRRVADIDADDADETESLPRWPYEVDRQMKDLVDRWEEVERSAVDTRDYVRGLRASAKGLWCNFVLSRDKD